MKQNFMKNLNTESIQAFKELGYNFEEIIQIDKGIQELNEGKGIPFYDVVNNFYKNQEKEICIK